MVCYVLTSYLRLSFTLFFTNLTISGQKRQNREHTLKLFSNFYSAPFFLWISSSFKNSPKSQNLRLCKKVSFLFCLSYIEKYSIVWPFFGIICKIKATKQAQKLCKNLNFLPPNWNKSKKLKKWKSAWILAQIFKIPHKTCLFGQK